MKILILTAATGGGHIRAAKAIQENVEKYTTHEIKIFDVFKIVSPLLDETICDAYLFLAKKMPTLFGRLYVQTNKDTPIAELAPAFNSMVSYQLFPDIEEYAPDVILSTHPFATEMVSYLKGRKKINVPLISIMTDYGIHRAWVADFVDSYIVASKNMVNDLVELDVIKDTVYPYGIPVFESFYKSQDKHELLIRENLDPNKKTILFMAGSFGVTHIIDLYKQLARINTEMQVVVITGKNMDLFETMQLEVVNSKHKTKLIYFTSEVEKYMHLADFIVTKPGGLTVSESLASNLPLVVFDAIPGQEEDNANFLEKNGMGIKLESDDDFASIISALLTNDSILADMKQACLDYNTVGCVDNIITLAEKLNEDYKTDYTKTAINSKLK